MFQDLLLDLLFHLLPETHSLFNFIVLLELRELSFSENELLKPWLDYRCFFSDMQRVLF